MKVIKNLLIYIFPALIWTISYWLLYSGIPYLFILSVGVYLISFLFLIIAPKNSVKYQDVHIKLLLSILLVTLMSVIVYPMKNSNNITGHSLYMDYHNNTSALDFIVEYLKCFGWGIVISALVYLSLIKALTNLNINLDFKPVRYILIVISYVFLICFSFYSNSFYLNYYFLIFIGVFTLQITILCISPNKYILPIFTLLFLISISYLISSINSVMQFISVIPMMTTLLYPLWLVCDKKVK